MLVDTHTHTWAADSEELPWKYDILPENWTGAYTHDDLVADNDRLGIDWSVIVTTPLYGLGLEANEYTLRSIEAHPDRLYGVGLLDYSSDSNILLENFGRLADHSNVLGIRIHGLSGNPGLPAGPEVDGNDIDPTADWFLSERYDPLWNEIVRREKVLYCFVKPEQLSMVDELARRHPGLAVVVDHLGYPDDTHQPDEGAWTAFEACSRRPNVHVKISGVGRLSTEGWPYADVYPYVRNLFDWFGRERLVFGSDYPMIYGYGISYEQSISWIREADFLSERDRNWLRSRAFENLHGL